MLYQQTVGRHARYAMLETLREFALEKLAESPDEPVTRQAHARYYLNWISGGQPTNFIWLPVSAEHISSWDRSRKSGANLREAVAWCIQSGDLETGGWLVQKQFQFWHRRGPLGEGRALAEQLLALEADRTPVRAPPRYCTAGFLAYAEADLDRARQRLEAGLTLARAIDDRMTVDFCVETSGRIALAEGDLATARRLLAEQLAIARGSGNADADLGRALAIRSAELSVSGEYATARSQWEDIARLGFPDAPPLQGLGHLALLEGDVDRAARLFYEALGPRAAPQLGPVEAGDPGRSGRARARARPPEAAARLLGARDQLFAQFGSRDDVVTHFFYDPALAGVRDAVAADALRRAWTAGASMSLDEAFAYARSIVPPPAGSSRIRTRRSRRCVATARWLRRGRSRRRAMRARVARGARSRADLQVAGGGPQGAQQLTRGTALRTTQRGFVALQAGPGWFGHRRSTPLTT